MTTDNGQLTIPEPAAFQAVAEKCFGEVQIILVQLGTKRLNERLLQLDIAQWQQYR